MTNRNYSSNQIATAAAQLFSIRKGIETSRRIRKAYPGRNVRASIEQFTWDEINTALFTTGWSPRHLVKLMFNLKNA